MTRGPATGPTYAEVVTWAEDVADGYDSRATMNRNALYGGALLGVAAASTLAALAIFNSGNPAIAGIPIGTAFVSGTMGFYNNYVRADLYDQASKYVRRLILKSRERGDANAVCLEWDVQDVIRIVSRHITMMDPANVTKALAAVKVDAKASDIATVAKNASTAKTDADKAANDAKQAGDAAKQAGDDASAATTAAGVTKAAGDATKAAGDAASAAKTASDFAKMASEVAKLLESTQGRFTDLQFTEDGDLPRRTHCPVPSSSK